MSSWAKRGARCICIAGNGRWTDTKDRSHKIIGPAMGDRLTILNVERLQHGVYVEFAEWPGPTFKVSAFRPLVEGSQVKDVALFAHHLDQSPARVTERVSA